ncbi:MAG: phosphoadenosine phosphosulfate reductase family protein [Magnetococcales bacterium]|nr:phosphoadenosine phosphosulfate reductase family protein [Magnetococcales bacterium]
MPGLIIDLFAGGGGASSGIEQALERKVDVAVNHNPIFYQIQEPLLEAGHLVVSWQGVRADESRSRANLLKMDRVGPRLWNYRPILSWSWQKVFDIHRHHRLEPNPLYKMGAARVGCMPCIHETKDGIRNIADRFPEQFDRIETWEMMVGRCGKRFGIGTFFSSDKIPGHDKTKPIPGIREVIKYSRTTRGGKQYGLWLQPEDEPPACSSMYGLCE